MYSVDWLLHLHYKAIPTASVRRSGKSVPRFCILFNCSFGTEEHTEGNLIMGKTFDSFKREIGKNTGKAVSNFFFGDSHATPYRRVDAERRAHVQEAALKQKERQNLNLLDGAVLGNVDIVLQTPIPQEEQALLQLMSIWGAQLASSKWNFDDDEGKIRAQYPDAILEKFKQCMIVMRIIAPTNPMAEHYEKILKKASRRRFIAKYKTPLVFVIWFGILALLFLIGSIFE